MSAASERLETKTNHGHSSTIIIGIWFVSAVFNAILYTIAQREAEEARHTRRDATEAVAMLEPETLHEAMAVTHGSRLTCPLVPPQSMEH